MSPFTNLLKRDLAVATSVVRQYNPQPEIEKLDTQDSDPQFRVWVPIEDGKGRLGFTVNISDVLLYLQLDDNEKRNMSFTSNKYPFGTTHNGSTIPPSKCYFCGEISPSNNASVKYELDWHIESRRIHICTDCMINYSDTVSQLIVEECPSELVKMQI